MIKRKPPLTLSPSKHVDIAGMLAHCILEDTEIDPHDEDAWYIMCKTIFESCEEMKEYNIFASDVCRYVTSEKRAKDLCERSRIIAIRMMAN